MKIFLTRSMTLFVTSFMSLVRAQKWDGAAVRDVLVSFMQVSFMFSFIMQEHTSCWFEWDCFLLSFNWSLLIRTIGFYVTLCFSLELLKLSALSSCSRSGFCPCVPPPPGSACCGSCGAAFLSGLSGVLSACPSSGSGPEACSPRTGAGPVLDRPLPLHEASVPPLRALKAISGSCFLNQAPCVWHSVDVR